jgi:hypothetical protein
MDWSTFGGTSAMTRLATKAANPKAETGRRRFKGIGRRVCLVRTRRRAFGRDWQNGQPYGCQEGNDSRSPHDRSNHSATSPLGGFSVGGAGLSIGHGILHAWLRNDFPRRRSPLRLSVTYQNCCRGSQAKAGSQAA